VADDERLAVRLLNILGDEAGLAEEKMFGSPMKGRIVVDAACAPTMMACAAGCPAGRPEPWPGRRQRQSSASSWTEGLARLSSPGHARQASWTLETMDERYSPDRSQEIQD